VTTDDGHGHEAAPEGMGEVSGDGARRTVRFERALDAPIDDVWDALTSPERLARWLAPTTIEARLGGEVHHDFGDGDRCRGTILVWDPPRRLSYGWHFTGEDDSVVTFDLHAVDEGTTRLRLEHRDLGSGFAVGYGAGWHAHLDGLTATVAGAAPVDWDQRFAEVLAAYR
jgi:uncharacterized protein YndB with AHSA1/START domain